MVEHEFERLAQAKIVNIFDTLDHLGDDRLDIDLQNGVLTIEVEDKGIYLINKHAPTKEIWVSSPLSGAWHFRLSDDKWVSTRGASAQLTDLLSEELSGILSQSIAFK